MAEPKCPSCSVEGIEHIISRPGQQQSQGGDTWFEVAYCKNCGHVYGVFAKRVLSFDVSPAPPLPPTLPQPGS